MFILQPVILHGHHSTISALALSTPYLTTRSIDALVYLCSASADSLLLWDLDSCYEQHTAGRCKLHVRLSVPFGHSFVRF